MITSFKIYEQLDKDNFDSYLDEMRNLRKEYYRTKSLITKKEFMEVKDKLKSAVKLRLIEEFSKYMKRVDVNVYHGFRALENKNKEYYTFLLDDGYGAKFEFENTGLGTVLVVINSIHLYNKKFMDGGHRLVYKSCEGNDIDIMVSNYVEKLRKNYIIWKNNADLRDMKKAANKYNI